MEIFRPTKKIILRSEYKSRNTEVNSRVSRYTLFARFGTFYYDCNISVYII